MINETFTWIVCSMHLLHLIQCNRQRSRPVYVFELALTLHSHSLFHMNRWANGRVHTHRVSQVFPLRIFVVFISLWYSFTIICDGVCACVRLVFYRVVCLYSTQCSIAHRSGTTIASHSAGFFFARNRNAFSWLCLRCVYTPYVVSVRTNIELNYKRVSERRRKKSKRIHTQRRKAKLFCAIWRVNQNPKKNIIPKLLWPSEL